MCGVRGRRRARTVQCRTTRKLSKNLTFKFERRECQLVGEGKGRRLRGAAVTVCTGFVAAGSIPGRRQRGHFYFAQKGTFLLCVDNRRMLLATYARNA